MGPGLFGASHNNESRTAGSGRLWDADKQRATTSTASLVCLCVSGGGCGAEYVGLVCDALIVKLVISLLRRSFCLAAIGRR